MLTHQGLWRVGAQVSGQQPTRLFWPGFSPQTLVLLQSAMLQSAMQALAVLVSLSCNAALEGETCVY